MNRTRDFGPNGGSDMSEAKHWQRRIYSGLVCIILGSISSFPSNLFPQVNLATLLPQDIGKGAAYEAYRMWKYYRAPLFDPLASSGMSGSLERVREALVGLAIGEGASMSLILAASHK